MIYYDKMSFRFLSQTLTVIKLIIQNGQQGQKKSGEKGRGEKNGSQDFIGASGGSVR